MPILQILFRNHGHDHGRHSSISFKFPFFGFLRGFQMEYFGFRRGFRQPFDFAVLEQQQQRHSFDRLDSARFQRATWEVKNKVDERRGDGNWRGEFNSLGSRPCEHTLNVSVKIQNVKISSVVLSLSLYLIFSLFVCLFFRTTKIKSIELSSTYLHNLEGKKKEGKREKGKEKKKEKRKRKERKRNEKTEMGAKQSKASDEMRLMMEKRSLKIWFDWWIKCAR